MRQVAVDAPVAPARAEVPLDRALLYVRWTAITALLALALAQPLRGRGGVPTWVPMAAFAVYSALVAASRRAAFLRRPVRAAALDLLVVSLLYATGATAAGPLFVLFPLITVCSVAVMPLLAGLCYTAAALVAVSLLTPTLPLWPHTAIALRDLFARLVLVAVAGATTAVLARRIEIERASARSSREDAARQMEINRLRGAFISSVSHDLRTPLTAIRAGLGMLELSLGERLRPDEEQVLAAARRNCDRLGLLVDDLLTYHQIEAGALRLMPTELDLAETLASAVAGLRPLLDEKGQRVDVELPERLPYTGDERRLEQVFVNLLANAHHHTPPGTTVRVSARPAPHELTITVADDGPGIPPDELGRVFARFHRVAPTSSGSGLGLAIVRGIVELHGGHIWAEAANGRGAAFHLALPLRRAGEATSP